MPTKQVTYRNDKAVVVRVYVEKPRIRKKRTSSSIQHQHQHHHYHYGSNKGSSPSYGRRAGLLMYSHLLRESTTRGASSTPSFSKWVVANNNLHPPTQIVPSNKKKPECEKKPTTCFGSLKLLLIPRFLRSWPKTQNKEKKMNKPTTHGMKTLQVWKGKCLFPNVFSTKRKHA